jgi:hypothetical protein
MSISSRAGQSTWRRSTWRSEPGCTADVRCLESSCRRDDDLIVSGVVKTKIELGPSPGYHKEVSKQSVGDRSDRADGDKDRRPSVDSGAEDWTKMI